MGICQIHYAFGSFMITASATDTWASLSHQFEVSEQQLKKENKQTTALLANQLVVIPQSVARVHIVSPAETIESICKKYNINKQQLQENNDNLQFLYVGKKLYLPKTKPLKIER